MSIIAYVGLPGSGKSYDVVANQILPALAAKRRVVTNIPLNRDEVRKKYLGGEIVELPLDTVAQQPELIDEYAVAGCLLVIDECWRLWPAGWKTDKIPQAFKSLLAEHRHKVDTAGRSMQIVLVTQDLSQIAAFARQLVEQTFHHTKLTHVGMRGSYRIDVFHGAVTGAVPPVSNRLREVFGKYKPAVFKMYKSHTMSESSKDGGDETALDGRGNIFRRPMMWAGIAGAILAFWWGGSTLADLLGGYGVGSATSVASAEPSPGPSEVSPSGGLVERARPVAPPARSKYSGPEYRIVGDIRPEADQEAWRALLTDGERIITVPWSRCVDHAEGEVRCKFRGIWVGEMGVVL